MLKIDLGKLRFLLALLVLFSHIRVDFFVKLGWDTGSIYNFNPGSVAVVNFFAISGFVMAGLWKNHYGSATSKLSRLQNTKAFYKDRFLRLFPQFIFWSALTIFAIMAMGIHAMYWKEINIPVFVHNLTMLPLGYNMYLHPTTLFIPQAWSLGLELTFYASIPFLLNRLDWTKIYTLGYMSMLFFIFPYLGLLNPFWYGYQLLPGILFIFILGISVIDDVPRRRVVYFRTCRSYTALLLVIMQFSDRLYSKQFNKEVLLGTLLATFFLPRIAATSTKLGSWLGNLSYGIFLNHILVAALLEEYFPQLRARIVGAIVTVVISFVTADISYRLVEKPAIKFRRQFRPL